MADWVSSSGLPNVEVIEQFRSSADSSSNFQSDRSLGLALHRAEHSGKANRLDLVETKSLKSNSQGFFDNQSKTKPVKTKIMDQSSNSASY